HELAVSILMPRGLLSTHDSIRHVIIRKADVRRGYAPTQVDGGLNATSTNLKRLKLL
ncbi:hypothetical protein K1T71_005374, partial [Dendrolimus kikuchii]